jgi:phosphopantothenoylcysteine synthetase/decarboxylase
MMWKVKTILTKSGREFVTPLSLSTLTKSKTFENIFDSVSEGRDRSHSSF